eukprot:TRINITY_DN1367_c0_g1_i2.p1 TRINITY_DN1367_c0_g1~~TRINITY_DN1367_c0_g1_i2.p1  ORF type:complete len:1509 (+),score=632.54 TRINITY_DN1367_c0_g1_i2:215-4741(+)
MQQVNSVQNNENLNSTDSEGKSAKNLFEIEKNSGNNSNNQSNLVNLSNNSPNQSNNSNSNSVSNASNSNSSIVSSAPPLNFSGFSGSRPPSGRPKASHSNKNTSNQTLSLREPPKNPKRNRKDRNSVQISHSFHQEPSILPPSSSLLDTRPRSSSTGTDNLYHHLQACINSAESSTVEKGAEKEEKKITQSKSDAGVSSSRSSSSPSQKRQSLVITEETPVKQISKEESKGKNLKEAQKDLEKVKKPIRKTPSIPSDKEGKAIEIEEQIQVDILKAKMSSTEGEFSGINEENEKEMTSKMKRLSLRKTHAGIPSTKQLRKLESARVLPSSSKSLTNSPSMRGSVNDVESIDPSEVTRTINPLLGLKPPKPAEDRYYDFDEKDIPDENIVFFEDENMSDDTSVDSGTGSSSLSGENLSSGTTRGRSSTTDSAKSLPSPRSAKEDNNNLEVRVIEGNGLLLQKEGGSFLDLKKKNPGPLSPTSLLKCDPFVIVKLTRGLSADSNSTSQKTKTIKKTPNPRWNETFWFQYDPSRSEQLHCAVHSHNRIGSSDFLGEATVNLSDLTVETPKDVNLQITEFGTIRVAISLRPKAVESASTVNSNLKGATLNKMIERMIPPEKSDQDPDLISEMLLGYRSYCTAIQLLDMFIQKYNGPNPEKYKDASKFERTLKAVQSSVANVLSNWLDDTFEFLDDKELSQKMMDFFNSIPSKPIPIERCVRKLTAIMNSPSFGHKELLRGDCPGTTSLYRFLVDPIPTTANSSSESSSKGVQTSFNDINDALLIAQQLTLIEYQILKFTRSQEFLKQAWNKSEKNTKAPHVLRYIYWFNRVSLIVATDILKCPTPEERSVVIGKWINVGVKLSELHNYSAVMEVISALHSAAVSRLQQSWAFLPSDLMDSFSSLTTLMSPNENFKQYRAACKRARTTCIPYLGLQLQDLTFMDDANSDYLGEEDNTKHIINYEKLKMITKRIKEFRDGIRSPYPFPTNELGQELWLNAEAWTDSDIFRMSKLRETRSELEEGKLPSRFDSKSFEKITKSIQNGKQLVSTTYKLTKRDWNLVIACSQLLSLGKDSIVVGEGLPNNSFYRVKSGRLRVQKVFKEAEGTIEKVLTHLKEGDNFGEMSCIEAYGVASASVIADTDVVELYGIDMQFLERLFSSEPGLAMRFYGRVANQLAEKLVSLAPPDKKKVEVVEDVNAPSPLLKDDKNDDGNSSEEESAETQKGGAVSSADTEKNRIEDILEKKFKIEDEVIIRAAKAVFKKKVNFHGDFVVTQHYVCFYSKAFGYSIKEKFRMTEVTSVTVEDKDVTIFRGSQNKKKFTFHDKNESKEMVELINPMRTRASVRQTMEPKNQNSPKYVMSPQQPRVNVGPSKSDMSKAFRVLPSEDWDMILKGGAKSIHVPKDGVIVSAGEMYQKIFQISRGVCRTEIEKDGKTIVLGTMGQDETFGEISFLRQGKGASASVIADSEDGVSLTIIEGYFINALFNIHADFAGRFFKYLATLLSFRIRDRQSS